MNQCPDILSTIVMASTGHMCEQKQQPSQETGSTLKSLIASKRQRSWHKPHCVHLSSSIQATCPLQNSLSCFTEGLRSHWEIKSILETFFWNKLRGKELTEVVSDNISPIDYQFTDHSIFWLEFVFRVNQAFSNCFLCPIVYNVYEQLKVEVRGFDWFVEDIGNDRIWYDLSKTI